MRLGSSMADFFAWWGRELVDLVPARVRSLLGPGRRLLAVTVAGDVVVVNRWIGSRRTEVFHQDRAGQAIAAGDALGSALRRWRGRTFDVVLCLGEGVLRTEITMPALPEAAMRRALSYQIDRLTPFPAADVCFDFRTLRVDPATRRTVVEMAVVPKKVVETHLRRASEWGVRPASVAVGDPQGSSRPVFDLTKGLDEPAAGRPVPRVVNAGLAIVLGLLLAALAFAVLEQRRMAADALAAEVAAARQSAHQASTLRAEIDRRRQDLGFFADRKTRRPLALAVLLEVTRVMPDHTWLSEFQLRDDEVQIAGYSTAASELIAAVDTSAMFREPRFRSPITRDPATGKERFTLTFRIDAPGGEGA